MKKIIILGTLVLISLPSIMLAAVSPFYKECMQRGYIVEDINSNSDAVAYCVFPDKTKCPIKEFNEGTCGQTFMTTNYCVKKGTMIWDENKCCAGTNAYLPKGVAGQARCQPDASVTQTVPVAGEQEDWEAFTDDEKKAKAIEALNAVIKKDAIHAVINTTGSGSGIKKIIKLEAENKVNGLLQRIDIAEKRLENREKNIEIIREKIASTTAFNSQRKLENASAKLQKGFEGVDDAADRLAKKELKVVDVLGMIAGKIQTRINIIKSSGLNMNLAEVKLAEAAGKIEEITVVADDLSELLAATITEENKDQLFTDIKTAQEKIRDLANETHTLLVDAVKEIAKVLPLRAATATTTD